MENIIVLLIILFLTKASRTLNESNKLEPLEEPSFEIDYENDQFLLDGEPFRYISGSFHYFRTPKENWRDRLRKMRAAGLNAISTYIEWSLHEPEPGMWDWSGDANISNFLQIAYEENLFVLLRPGPYICAERDLGGLPSWLLSLEPNIELRTNDQSYMKYVEKYLEEVLTRIRPYLRGNGGPIIMVQIENEYGSFNACDHQYMSKLKDIFNNYVASKAVLYTTDGPQYSILQCGHIPGVYTTVDFGTSANVTESFQVMRRFQPKGPLVNSEFYPGWLSHWGESVQNVTTLKVIQTLDEILFMGASVNIYMFYGGTNFGFTSGANSDPNYQPQLTSYDYDAPLTEAGDVTPKYFAMRDVIAKYLPLPELPIPTIAKKMAYGVLTLEPVIQLFDPLSRALFSSTVIQARTTPTFEELQLRPLQLVLYETQLPVDYQNSAILEALVHDRAYVYSNERLVGTLSRTHDIFRISLQEPYGKKLSLLVENQGHINFGNEIKDYKGLWNVMLNNNELLTWNVTGFGLDDISPLDQISNTASLRSEVLHEGPTFYRGKFNIEETPFDTFLDTTGWGKGVAYINGYNLGRYWSIVGPQQTLYVPDAYLNRGDNELIVLEYEYVPKLQGMTFRSNPKFD